MYIGSLFIIDEGYYPSSIIKGISNLLQWRCVGGLAAGITQGNWPWAPPDNGRYSSRPVAKSSKNDTD